MKDITDLVMVATGLTTFVAAIVVWFLAHRAIYSVNIPKEKRPWISFSLLATLLIWVSLSHLLGLLKVFRMAAFLVPLIAFGLPYISMRIFSKSQTFEKIVNVLPNHWIIGIQAYRLLGIVFLTLYSAGVLPAEFAIPSGMGDIIIGIAAPIVAYLFFIKGSYARNVGTVWNYLGIADLTIAVIMGSITAPTLIQLLSFDQPNEPIISYPLVTVPTFAVPFSFILHFISLRMINRRDKKL